MAVSSGMDSHELSDLVRNMYRTAEQHYPDRAKDFLKDQANAGRRKLRAKTKAVTKKKSGNLLKGIRRTGVQKYGDDLQIRVYNKAPHAHLIEHGHVIWVPTRTPSGDIGAKKTNNKVAGRHPGADTTKELKENFSTGVEKFVDKLLKEGLEL